MNPHEIRHFLVTFNLTSGETVVRQFGTDYDAAQNAYSEAEEANSSDSNLDIVLLSADSLETIEQTHSSYFNGGNVQLLDLLPS